MQKDMMEDIEIIEKERMDRELIEEQEIQIIIQKARDWKEAETAVLSLTNTLGIRLQSDIDNEDEEDYF